MRKLCGCIGRKTVLQYCQEVIFMYCNQCGTQLYHDHNYCMECGAPRPVLPPRKKGSLIVPLLICALMAGFGCFVYWCSLYGPWFG
jgi:hypothetical protein